MSHLSTIIGRIRNKEMAYEQEPNELLNDTLFEQAIINLMEYMEYAKDVTAEERELAVILYDKYRPLLKGKGMPSHKQRLKDADKVRQVI